MGTLKRNDRTGLAQAIGHHLPEALRRQLAADPSWWAHVPALRKLGPKWAEQFGSRRQGVAFAEHGVSAITSFACYVHERREPLLKTDLLDGLLSELALEPHARWWASAIVSDGDRAFRRYAPIYRRHFGAEGIEPLRSILEAELRRESGVAYARNISRLAQWVAEAEPGDALFLSLLAHRAGSYRKAGAELLRQREVALEALLPLLETDNKDVRQSVMALVLERAQAMGGAVSPVVREALEARRADEPAKKVLALLHRVLEVTQTAAVRSGSPERINTAQLDTAHIDPAPRFLRFETLPGLSWDSGEALREDEQRWLAGRLGALDATGDDERLRAALERIGPAGRAQWADAFAPRPLAALMLRPSLLEERVDRIVSGVEESTSPLVDAIGRFGSAAAKHYLTHFMLRGRHRHFRYRAEQQLAELERRDGAFDVHAPVEGASDRVERLRLERCLGALISGERLSTARAGLVYEQNGRLALAIDAGRWLDADGAPCEPLSADMRLAHPAEMSEGARTSFEQQLARSGLEPPIDQLGRPRALDYPGLFPARLSAPGYSASPIAPEYHSARTRVDRTVADLVDAGCLQKRVTGALTFSLSGAHVAHVADKVSVRGVRMLDARSRSITEWERRPRWIAEALADVARLSGSHAPTPTALGS